MRQRQVRKIQVHVANVGNTQQTSRQHHTHIASQVLPAAALEIVRSCCNFTSRIQHNKGGWVGGARATTLAIQVKKLLVRFAVLMKHANQRLARSHKHGVGCGISPRDSR